MLHDSLDVGVLAENVRLLQKEIKEAGSEVPTPGAGDTGKILKVGSDGYELATEYSYTLPPISETETDTGLVFNGETVFSRNFYLEGVTSGDNMITIGPVTTIKHCVFGIARILTYTDDVLANEWVYNPRYWHTTNSVNAVVNASGGLVGGNLVLTVFYTKFPPASPDVVPSPDNDTRSVDKPIEEVTEEPVQETKTRKRSTSSK